MYAECALLRRMPAKIETLTYGVPPEFSDFRAGEIVWVPYRGKRQAAVVVELHESPGVVDPKKILPITERTGVALPEPYLRVFLDSAAYFATSASILADALIPAPPKRRKETAPAPSFARPIQTTTPELVWIRDPKLAYRALAERARILVESGIACLVLVPEAAEIDATANALADIGRLGVVTEKMSAGKLWKLFEDCVRGDIDVLVTTRRGVLFPLPRLGAVMIWHEDSPSHKQYDMNPRYDARFIASRLAEAAGAVLVSFSELPRLVTRDAKLTELGERGKPDIVVHAHGRSSELLSPPTIEAIAEALEDGRDVTVIAPQADEARVAVCRACQAVKRCPQCESPMREAKGRFHCQHCGRDEATAPCTACGGTQFRFLGWGKESLREAQKGMFTEDAGKITVTDELGFLGGSGSGAKLVVSLNPDGLLSSKEFTAEERSFMRLLRIRDRMSSDATWIIVAKTAQRMFGGLSAEREQEFLRVLLEERRTLGYPPFGALVKCIVQDPDRAKARTKAEALAEQLSAGAELDVLGPYEPAPPFVRGNYRSLILLKGAPTVIAALKPKLKSFSDEMLIDIDPERVFR